MFDTLPRVRLENVELRYEDSLRLLGVQLDCTLSWAPQVKAVTSKVFAAVHQLKRLRNFLPLPLRTTLVRALILPILHYCSVVYSDLSEELDIKLQRSFNCSIRFIFDARRDAQISPFFDELRWLKLSSRRQYFMLITL